MAYQKVINIPESINYQNFHSFIGVQMTTLSLTIHCDLYWQPLFLLGGLGKFIVLYFPWVAHSKFKHKFTLMKFPSVDSGSMLKEIKLVET